MLSVIYEKKSGAKICLPIKINMKMIFILTISLFVKIVSYFVFLYHISDVQLCMFSTLTYIAQTLENEHTT